MNVINQFWKALFQGDLPGVTAFTSPLSLKAKGVWEKNFAICKQVD